MIRPAPPVPQSRPLLLQCADMDRDDRVWNQACWEIVPDDDALLVRFRNHFRRSRMPVHRSTEQATTRICRLEVRRGTTTTRSRCRVWVFQDAAIQARARP